MSEEVTRTAAEPTCCPRCMGGGVVAGEEPCAECAGQPFTNLDGITLVCEHCHGTGRRNVACPECGGHPH